jgi:hypothetical protein
VQQIRNFKQNKKASKSENLPICNNTLAGDESRRWNTLINHLALIADKVEEQGFTYDPEANKIMEVAR